MDAPLVSLWKALRNGFRCRHEPRGESKLSSYYEEPYSLKAVADRIINMLYAEAIVLIFPIW